MGGLRTLAGIAAVAALFAIVACDDEKPKPPQRTPETVAEFFDALNFGIQSDGQVFHAAVDIRFRENGVETQWGTTEGWVEEGAARARTQWTKGPGNTADMAERTIHIYAPDGVYASNPGSGDQTTFRLNTDAEPCLLGAPAPVLALVACGFLDSAGPLVDLAVEASTFAGKPTISLVGKFPVSSPLGSEEYPRGGPTPHPVLTAATNDEFRLHLDPATYLPIATTSYLDSDPDGTVFGGVMRFQTEFVAKASLPADWFDPESIGYVPPAREEQQKLERKDLQTPVYWLGRDFDPGGGLPLLSDLFVNSYGPRPSRGDEPNIQLGLAYRGQGGGVRLDLYPPGDWEQFKARLGGNFPWTWCSQTTEFTRADGAKVTILAGYESFPYREDPGQVTAVRPGESPPTPAPPTVPPLKTERCPSGPPDRFMAEVSFKDATVVINGTLSYGGQDGRPWGVFDTAEGMEAVARGLRLRHPGE